MQECGVTFFQSNVRIVGGVDAHAGSWPAQVKIYVTVNGVTYMCGGTLVDLKAVITAAHCIFSLDPAAFGVYLGKML